MSSPEHLKSFVRYKEWANNRIFHWLSKLSSEELVSKHDTLFCNIIGTMNHTYEMDAVWRAHLEGKPHQYTTYVPSTNPTLPELQNVQTQIDEWYIEYTDNLLPEEVDELVNFTFITGGAGSMTRGNILLHVVNHATYHRAHIDNHNPISVTAPVTDLPVFLCARP